MVMVAATAGCPHVQSNGPELPSQGAPAARVRFDRARESFQQADYQAAKKELDEVVHEFPDDPIAPFAELYGAMAEFRLSKPDLAAKDLRRITDDQNSPPAVRARARFFLGLADVQLGRAPEARTMLEPFRGKLDDPEENGELHAALASADAQTGDAISALAEYDTFWGAARPAERVYVIAQVATLVDHLTDDAADAAYGRLDKHGPAMAFLGRRLAAQARAAGHSDRASAIMSDTAVARSRSGSTTST